MNGALLHGLLAEFSTAQELLAAVTRARHEVHHARLEAYSPYPIAGLVEVLGPPRDHIAPVMLLGAVLGGLGTFALEWYSAVYNYPLNIGARPLNSWPAFVPPALEMTILGAALFGVVAMLVGNRLPRLHHPLFTQKVFERASSDRFFLLLRAENPRFDTSAAREFLTSLGASSVNEVPA